MALATFVGSLFVVPLLGTEFVPKADFSETSLSFHTPVGSSLQATEAKTREVEAILRQFPEVKYTLSTLNTGNAQGTMYASVYVRLVDRKDRTLSVDAMSAQLRERLRSVPGITVTHVGLLDAVGGNKQVEFSLQGDDLAELERLSADGDGAHPPHRRPGRSGRQREAQQAHGGREDAARAGVGRRA